MNHDLDVRRRRPLLVVFAVLGVALIVGSVALILRIGGHIERTSSEYNLQARRVTTMNYVHRDTLVWQSQLASLGTDRDFTTLRLRRSLLARQMSVVSKLSDDAVEQQAMSYVYSNLAEVDRVVGELSLESKAEDFAETWASIKEPLASIASTLKQLYHHSEHKFLSAVDIASRDARRSKMLLVVLGGLLLAIVGAFALMLRQAIRTDFREAYRKLRGEMTDREAAERALATREAHFRSLVQNSSDVITLLDAQGRILYESPSVARNLGFEPGSRVGLSVLDGIDHPELLAQCLTDVASQAGASKILEFRTRDAHGHQREVEATITNLLEDVNVAGIVMNHRDISERKRLESELRQQALHDPLTGLANRTLLRERVQASLVEAARTHRSVAVALLDLDEFKQVNDTHGHGPGDELLKIVAERLVHAIRPGDLVARLGGDEFAILFTDVTSRDDARSAAARVLESISIPASVSGVDVNVRASLGLAVAPADGMRPEELLRNADIAMYAAKARGKGRWEAFYPAMRQEVLARAQMEVELTAAIARDELILEYQPAVDIRTRRIRAVEALVRWPHPIRGMLGPAAFIGFAEESGLIVPMGRWVLNQACRQVQEWRERIPGAEELSVNVNLSPRQIADPRIVADVRGALEASALPPDRLVLEITESALLSEDSGARDVLANLRELGVHLAIDDFGTGFSSLGYLRFLPIDMLKIDKSFIDDLDQEGDPALLRGIIQMASSLSLSVVAEGVERDGQADRLIALGCTLAQGFHFARPMPPEALQQMLTSPLDASRSAWHESVAG